MKKYMRNFPPMTDHAWNVHHTILNQIESIHNSVSHAVMDYTPDDINATFCALLAVQNETQIAMDMIKERYMVDQDRLLNEQIKSNTDRVNSGFDLTVWLETQMQATAPVNKGTSLDL